MTQDRGGKVLVRIACADLREAEELSKLLSGQGAQHGPISTVEPSPELALDLSSVVGPMHQIIVLIEAFVIVGTLVQWFNHRAAKAGSAAAGAAQSETPTKQQPVVVHIGGHVVLVDENTDPAKVRELLEKAQQAS